MNETNNGVLTNPVTLTCQEVRIGSYLTLATSLNTNYPRRGLRG